SPARVLRLWRFGAHRAGQSFRCAIELPQHGDRLIRYANQKALPITLHHRKKTLLAKRQRLAQPQGALHPANRDVAEHRDKPFGDAHLQFPLAGVRFACIRCSAHASSVIRTARRSSTTSNSAHPNKRELTATGTWAPL